MLASSTSSLGACSVWGCSVAITFPAGGTVDDEDGVVPEIGWAPVVFVSVAGTGEALLDAAAVPFTVGAWLPCAGGAPPTANGGAELAVVGAAVRGTVDSALVALVEGGFTIVVGTVVVGTVVVGTVVVGTVKGGASGVCVGGGVETLDGADGVVTGAVVGAAGDGTSAGVDGTWALGAGTATVVVVVGVTGSVFGLASAGASPPVSAVKETTIPDASTATTLRRQQISSDAPTCVDSFSFHAAVADTRHGGMRSHLPQRWAWTNRCRGSQVRVGPPRPH